jgi:signal peptidase I
MESNATKRVIPNALFFATVEEVIAEGRSVEMTVKGFSMRPLLRNGRDVVTLSPVAEGDLREGMVVLFRHKGNYVLHRIRKIEGQRLTIEGDGNYRLREEAQRGDVVAMVSRVQKGRGGFRYGSFAWLARSAWSLAVKRLRTVAIDLKRMIKR